FPESLAQLVCNTFGDSKANSMFKHNDSNIISISPQQTSKFSTALTNLDDWLFHLEDAQELLKKQFNVRELTGFGLSGKNEAIRAAAACLRYAQETQRATAEHISEI